MSRSLLPLFLILALTHQVHAQAKRASREEGYWIQDHGFLLVEYRESSEATAARVVTLFKRAQAEVEERLGLTLVGTTHAVVAPTDAEFSRRYKLAGGEAPKAFVLAAAFSNQSQVLIRESGLAEGTNSGLYRTLKHELAHLVLGGLQQRRRAPLARWLNEGLSEWAAGRKLTPAETSALTGWARFETIPKLASLTDTFPPHSNSSQQAYTLSLGFVAWLHARVPTRTLTDALAVAHTTEEAFTEVHGMSVEQAEQTWHEELAAAHNPLSTLVHTMTLMSLIAFLAILAGLRVIWIRKRRLREMDGDPREKKKRKKRRKKGRRGN